MSAELIASIVGGIGSLTKLAGDLIIANRTDAVAILAAMRERLQDMVAMLSLGGAMDQAFAKSDAKLDSQITFANDEITKP